MMNRSNNDLEFITKTYRNLEIERNVYVILLLVMRHGFITDRLVESQAILAGLVKMSHQEPLFVETDLNPEHYFSYFLNQLILFSYIVYVKVRLSITTTTLIIVSNLLSMTYGIKKNHHAQNVSGCFMIMDYLINIKM